MRVKLIVEYEGTNYSGWQVQENAASIQGELEAALFRATGERRRIIGATPWGSARISIRRLPFPRKS